MGNVVHINRIISTTPVINSDERIVLSNIYDIDDFEQEALITKRGVLSLLPSGTVPPVTTTASMNDALPIVLDYAANYSQFGDYPTIQIRTSTGQDITSTATITYGSADPLDTISIDVSNDGTNVLSQDILIIIKS